MRIVVTAFLPSLDVLVAFAISVILTLKHCCNDMGWTSAQEISSLRREAGLPLPSLLILVPFISIWAWRDGRGLTRSPEVRVLHIFAFSDLVAIYPRHQEVGSFASYCLSYQLLSLPVSED